MEFHQVKYFLAICDHMNFTRAAESCAVSQPALTVAIQKLEANLGGSLFLRDGRQLSLTSLGRVMKTHLTKIEETRQMAYGAAAEVIVGEMEHIELGIMCTIGPRTIGSALAAWQKYEPGVELILHDVWGEKAQELLLSGALDCVLLARQEPLPARFDTIPLMTEAFELAYASDASNEKKEPVEISDLNGFRYLDRLRCEFREAIFGIAEKNDLEMDIVMRSEREDWIQNLVASGLGVTMLPRSSIVVEGISTCTVKGLPTERTIDLVTVRGRPLRNVVKHFVNFIGEYDFKNSQ